MSAVARSAAHSAARIVSLFLSTILVAGAAAVASPSAAMGTEVTEASADPVCGSTVTPAPPAPREINLVLDDSGSMFAGSANGPPLDRWSQAKYSLEVFAAMLDTADTLNVYRMSDFATGATSGPAETLSGSEPTSSRVARIHAMQMQGGGTPYAPVTQAYRDLVASSAPDKWLVVLSDGSFEGQDDGAVQNDLRRFAEDGSSGETTLRVAFLAIGDSAPTLRSEPDRGVFFEKASASSDLLGKMTQFSNLIFDRDVLPETSDGRMTADLDLSQVMVFAQGKDVTIGELSIDGRSLEPRSTVAVSWAENADVRWDSGAIKAEPNKDLEGVLATFDDVPAGTGVFDIAGAETIEVYYKPDVNFGVVLRDIDDRRVDASKIIAGTYTVQYGFMDDNCELIHSALLGDVEYSAKVVRDGEVIADAFASGDEIDLARGAVQLDVSARYLGESTAESTIDLTVLQAARPTTLTVESTTFNASELNEYTAPDGAIRVDYALASPGGAEQFNADEWAHIDTDSFTVTTDADLDFEVVLADEPGLLYLVPQAPGGDIFEASTGEVTFTLTASHVYDEQLYESAAEGSTVIVDDLPFWERLARWFARTGWWMLLLILLAILIVGYVVKPRFSPRIKRRPTVTGVPMSVSARAEEGRGKFAVQPLRKWMPFVADKATYIYVPAGVAGFRAMRLKAQRGGRMQLTNWKQVAERRNVAVNSTDLNEETSRMPVLGPSSNVTATVAQQIRYESYLNV
ncbi:hypothetical protein [Microbacterium sp.]|uniref:hypothetical protein n=1 Tax=Microbacterium sp. TaxID=51671 RepID=UPI0037C904AC